MQGVSKKTVLFLGAVILQLLGLLVLGLSYGSIVAQGRDVLLKIAPIDPRDPLRGDYVTFQYDISRLQSYLFYDNQATSGSIVYVVLLPSRPYWVPSGVYINLEKARSAAGSSGVVLKGTVSSSPLDSGTFDQSGQVRLSYGIEQYFIPEGTGRTVSFWNNDMSASVKVGPNGTAVLQKIFMNGQPWP